MTDVDFMSEAFAEAQDALAKGEVPVGCVFVHKGKIIAKGRNSVNETLNATRHAEINCIDQVVNRHQNTYFTVLREVEVFVTVEPCAMCADALGQLGVKSVTFGCSNDRFGGCGSVTNVPRLYNYKYSVTGGVRAEEAVQMLKDFYKQENPFAPLAKARKKS